MWLSTFNSVKINIFSNIFHPKPHFGSILPTKFAERSMNPKSGEIYSWHVELKVKQASSTRIELQIALDFSIPNTSHFLIVLRCYKSEIISQPARGVTWKVLHLRCRLTTLQLTWQSSEVVTCTHVLTLFLFSSKDSLKLINITPSLSSSLNYG